MHESVEQFRLAQETLGIVTWIWDTATDRVQWHGDASRMLGLRANAFSGRFGDYLKLVHPDDAAAAKRNFIDCLKGRHAEYRTQERVIWPDGSEHWLETYGRAAYGANGRALRVSGVIKEITERKNQESARLKAEMMLSRVFDASPDYIVIVRAGDGEFLAANGAFERATGYRAQDIVGSTVGAVNLWAIPGERERFLADLTKGGGSLQNRPVLVRTRSGAIISGKMSASVIEHEGERLIVSMMHDITEAKRLERRAHQSERKFAALFETSPVGLVVTQPRERRIVEINDAALQLIGATRDEAIGALIWELVTALHPEEIEALRERALRGEPVIGKAASLQRRDGKQVSTLLSMALIELEGEPHFVISLLDVTEQRRIERERQEADARFRGVFETSPAALVVVRPRDRTILEINERALRMFGLTREQAVAARLADAWTPLDHDRREQSRARLLAGETLSAERMSFVRQDGKQVEALVSATSVELGGEPYFLLSYLDVTEQRRIERERRQAESKYSALFASNPEAIIITRIRDALILAVNAAWERYSGHPGALVLGRSALSLGNWARAEDRAAIVARLEAEGTVSNVETRFVRADGAQIEVLLSVTRLEIDGEACAIWTWRDVSQMRETERRAHESERKFAALFENSPEPISLMRLSDHVRLAANSAWERVTGHSREQASLRPAKAMSMFRDPGERARLIERVEREDIVSNVEQRLRRADGTEFDALISGVCIEVEGERCILWNWRDVSEQRRLERAQREADARYRALFETALDGILVGTTENVLIDANPAACAMTGYSREELAGMHVARLFHPDEFAARPMRQDVGRKWALTERALARKDGGALTVEILAGPMADGKVLGIMRDVTERKRNETLLMNVARGISAELGEAFFRSLAGHLTRELGADFAFIGDLTGEDPQLVRTLAFVADGAMRPATYHPLRGSMSEQPLARGRTVVFAQGVRERFPGNADMQREGVEAYVGTPLYGADGKPVGVLAVGHRKPIERPQFWASMIEIFGARAAAEIERARAEALVRRTNESLEQTVRERTAELQEANRDLESYNSSISHDLRQPLNAIAGFAELLRDPVTKAIGGMAQECVAEIESNATRMERMIESLLRLARAGRGAIRKGEVDARGLVDGVLHDLSSSAPLGADVVVVGELPAAQGDPVLLRQVWANLVGNAIKYSRRSLAPRIEISGERRNGAVEYIIRDNGVGFDMQHAGRLFGTFQRLPTAAGFEGSGIGLAIVERIVRRHGGTISAESSPGAGATFRFTLPDTGLS